MKTIVVTGINGFVGHHLAKELHNQSYRVVGTGREPSLMPNLQPFVSSYIKCDLLNKSDVANIPIDNTSAIINLAGLAKVGGSFKQKTHYMKVNVNVQTNIVKRLLVSSNIKTRVVAVSTGAIYDTSQEMPLTEKAQVIKSGSPYALSKLYMEKALQEYIDAGIDIVIARPFNHIGPGQLSGFIVPDLAEQVMLSDVVSIGNLETKRDYTDVRDVVKAYVSLATTQNLNHRIYNICSGTSVSGQQILDLIKSNYKNKHVKTIIDSSKIRPDDPTIIYGSSERLKNDTGWKPSYNIKTTIYDYVNWLDKRGVR